MLIGFGIRPAEFWEYSPAEAVEVLEAFERREKRHRKEQIRDIFLQAEVQSRYLTVSKNTEIPRPWEYYPELFSEDKQAFEVQKEADDMEACRNNRRRYAAEFNRRRQQGR